MPNRYTVMKRAPITESERGAPDIFRRLTGLARLYTISSALSQIPHKILVDSPDGGYGCRKGTSGVASSRQRRNRLKLVISTFWAIYRIPALILIGVTTFGIRVLSHIQVESLMVMWLEGKSGMLYAGSATSRFSDQVAR